MPILSPKEHGSIVSAYEAEVSGTTFRDVFKITFPNASWGGASIFCVFSDSAPISGTFTAEMEGYSGLTSTNVTIHDYQGPADFGTNFQFVYPSVTGVQTLQMRSNSSSDAIQALFTIVTSSRGSQSDPIFTGSQ